MFNEQQIDEFFKDFENNSLEKFKIPIDFNPITTKINTIGDIEIEIKKKKIIKYDSVIKENDLTKRKIKATNLF